jgi:thiol-disulfide isomerase/thioredoxin
VAFVKRLIKTRSFAMLAIGGAKLNFFEPIYMKLAPLFRSMFFAVLGLAPAHAQAQAPSPETLQPGIWRGEIQMQGQRTPFNFEVGQRKGQPVLYLLNAEERLMLDEVRPQNDSLVVQMHIFEATLVFKPTAGQWAGYWVKSQSGREVYRLPFVAMHGQGHRFSERPGPVGASVEGTYEVQFTNAEGKVTPAIGLFDQKGTRLTGSFLTATGDYRFLEGEVTGQDLRLSTFNGESAYLFQAQAQGDSLLGGQFWSGRSGYTKWVAKKNPNFKLPEADKLTFLKPGHDRLAFSFPDLNGQKVSLDDPKYQGKVVIVQLLGSWCPNCMDETGFLVPYYKKHKDKGLAIIGLAYERSPKFEDAKARLEKMAQRLGVTYDLLVAGTSDKGNASASLPMLNHVMAFPTTIYIDRTGKVRKIHTGFAGPGTGKYYEEFVDEFTNFVSKLLREKQQ